jgi:hypothetical protein
MNNETTSKESDSSGVYFRRVVHDATGNLVSDERIKKDPVLVFTQPAPVSLGTADSVTVTIAFQLLDFDGEPRLDSGEVHFRLWDRDVPGDEGVPFTRQLVAGALELLVEFDAPGRFVVTIEPPLVADMQLPEPVQIKVE